MKVLCPNCSTCVPTKDISLETGWAKCEACEEIFPLQDLAPGFPAPGFAAGGLVPRPFNARAIVERSGQELFIHVPAEGMRAATWGTLGFATVWLGFITFWTLGASGIFWAADPRQPLNWAFASFSIPFWIIGFGMLISVAWNVWATRTVHIDSTGLTTRQRCLTWSRTRTIELERVQHARPYHPRVKSTEERPFGVEIIYAKGSFVLPADSEDEEHWLLFEINDFLKALTT